MELERYRKRGSDAEDLHTVCEQLWAEHIRTDLIFGRNLWLCLPCLAFYYSTPDADHPREQSVLVQRYFSDRSITSPAKLLDFIKEALGSAAATMGEQQNTGVSGLGDGDKGQTCVYPFTEGGTVTNSFYVDLASYATQTSFDDVSQFAGGETTVPGGTQQTRGGAVFCLAQRRM